MTHSVTKVQAEGSFLSSGMLAPRNYGATREAPGPSRVQLPVIPAVSLDEEQESGPVQNDDDYSGIESFRTRQPEELIQGGAKFSS